MAYDPLNNGDFFGIQRGRLNGMLEELYNTKIETNQVLTKTNIVTYSPTLDYHPATKLYADQMRTNWDVVFNPQSINADVFDRANHTGFLAPAVITQDANNRFVTDVLISNWNDKENSIGTKNTAFNKNFGTVANSIATGNHSHTKQDLGLGNVDNTSDENKPISTVQQNALDLKAPKTTTYTKDQIDDFLDDERDLTNLLFGDEPNGNYSEFNSDGVLKMNGDAKVFDEIMLMLTGAELHPSQSPTWKTFKGGQALSFSATAAQTIYFRVQLPKKWAEGTDITPKIHAVHESSETGTVIWDLTISWANEGLVFPTETTIQKSFTENSTIDGHDSHLLDAISGVNKEKSSIAICSLTRRGDVDTSTTETLLIGVNMIILIDSLGSVTK